MAELGPIQYTNVNQGTRVVDRSLESRAVAQGLDIVKKTVDEGIKAKVTGDMLDAIDETSSEVKVYEPAEFTPGSREAYLSSKLDRLNSVIEQGDVSRQTWAQMQVDRVLAEAQTKYPWMFDELQSRAGAVKAGSARLKQLGIDDAARSDAAKMAQEEYDTIVDHGRLDWENGGLGIPDEIDPRSEYWIQMYDKRQALRNHQETGTRLAGMAVANAQLDIHSPGNFERLSTELQGRISLISASYEGIKERNNWRVYLGEVRKGYTNHRRF